MAHVPCCNLHPDCRMVPTAVLIESPAGVRHIFEAYQCPKWQCTKYYAAGRGYFDITDPLSEYVEDCAARSYSCPLHAEILFARCDDEGGSRVYQCPVSECQFTQPYHPADRLHPENSAQKACNMGKYTYGMKY
jgi:hypothetical protein